MKIDLEKMLRRMIGIKDDHLEADLWEHGFKWEYELDGYVVYRGNKCKLLYDIKNKAIVGYSEIKYEKE